MLCKFQYILFFCNQLHSFDTHSLLIAFIVPQPPSRQTCDELFTAADKDNSGEIDRGEFVEIIQVCCAQIMSRILIYYLIIIVLVPLVATQIVNGLDDYFEIPDGTPKERAAESAVGFILFSLAVPILWNKVDRISRESLEKKKTKEVKDKKA